MLEYNNSQPGDNWFLQGSYPNALREVTRKEQGLRPKTAFPTLAQKIVSGSKGPSFFLIIMEILKPLYNYLLNDEFLLFVHPESIAYQLPEILWEE